MQRRLFHVLVAVGVLASVVLPSARAIQPEVPTQALAKELAGLLQQRKLEAIAARLDGDTFVAALFYPGGELLVVSAKYAAPTLINEKILNRNYREAYLDLASASVAGTKLMVEDSNADGIRQVRVGKQPCDVVTRGADAPLSLDGDWKKQSMTEDAYAKAFREAETAYRHMLESLVAELKKPR
jgi:hypothetical protein